MKQRNFKTFALLIFLALFVTACGGDDTEEPTPNDPNDNTQQTIQEINIVVFDGDTIKMTEITCNPNTFGKPRLAFSAKNADQSISAKIDLRGTDPEHNTKFTVDPDLDNGTTSIKFYYDSKNWTCTLDPNNEVTHLSDDTKRNIFGKNIAVVNDKDDQEKLMVEFNLTCTKP